MSNVATRVWSQFADWFSGGTDVAHQSGGGLERSFAHTWPWAPWVTLLLLLLVGSFVFRIYRQEALTSRWLRIAFIGLRVAAIAIVIFMMYGWVERQHRTELPELVVAIDVSESMAMVDRFRDDRLDKAVKKYFAADASRLGQAKWLLALQQRDWLTALERKYRVKLVAIGDSVREFDAVPQQDAVDWPALQAADSSSRLGQGIRNIIDAQRGRSTAAIVVLTDGVTTAGPTLADAATYARARSLPLHIVGLGSSHPPRDVRLNNLLVDEVAFVGDVLNFDLQLHHVGMEKRQVVVRLLREGESTPLSEVAVELAESETAVPIRLAHRPTNEGDFTYEIAVSRFDDEVNQDNNRLTRTIRVQNATIRVLMVQSAPSYEYRYLKSLLSRAIKRGAKDERAIELTTVLQEADLDFIAQDEGSLNVFPVQQDELFAFDVIIFGDANPAFFSQSVLDNLRQFVMQRGGGIVFIAGPNFFPKQYVNSPLADLLPFDPSTAILPSASESLNEPLQVRPTTLGLDSPTLQLGNSPSESSTVWSQLPELRWLLEIPDVNTTAMVLAEHPTRQSISSRPLPVILLQFVGAGKVVFHATDETFLWARFQGDDDVYGRYWHQTLRYLSRTKLLADRSPIDLMSDSQQYVSGDDVYLRVLFRDERLAPAANDGVTVMVQSDDGSKQTITLFRSTTQRGLFAATVRDLSVGKYGVQLATPVVPKQPSALSFTVNSLLNERSRLEMDLQGLKAAAEISKGRFYTVRNASRLIRDLPPGNQVRIESSPAEPIWNSSWLAGLFILVLATEWILRKRAGLL